MFAVVIQGLAFAAALFAFCFWVRHPLACCWIWAFTTALWGYASVAGGRPGEAAINGACFVIAVRWLVLLRRDKLAGDGEPAPAGAGASSLAALTASAPDPLEHPACPTAMRPSP